MSETKNLPSAKRVPQWFRQECLRADLPADWAQTLADRFDPPISPITARRYRRAVLAELGDASPRRDLGNVVSDKKTGKVDWRELCHHIAEGQRIRQEASWSQDEATWCVPDAKKPISIVVLGDLHWGSWGTDHSIIEEITDEILSIPDLYIIAAGDLEQMAIKLRGVQEVMDNAIDPDLQHAFTESWLEEIGHRIICATWDNHSVMREENQAGSSQYKRLMSRKVIYHGHIGHIDIGVGSQLYKFAVSHHFRGRSMLNPLHSHMRYMRHEAQDREVCVGADTHVPGIMKYWESGKERLAVNCGTAQARSGYARRFFSLKSLPVFPVITLFPDQHAFEAHTNLDSHLRFRDGWS